MIVTPIRKLWLPYEDGPLRRALIQMWNYGMQRDPADGSASRRSDGSAIRQLSDPKCCSGFIQAKTCGGVLANFSVASTATLPFYFSAFDSSRGGNICYEVQSGFPTSSTQVGTLVSTANNPTGCLNLNGCAYVQAKSCKTNLLVDYWIPYSTANPSVNGRVYYGCGTGGGGSTGTKANVYTDVGHPQSFDPGTIYQSCSSPPLRCGSTFDNCDGCDVEIPSRSYLLSFAGTTLCPCGSGGTYASGGNFNGSFTVAATCMGSAAGPGGVGNNVAPCPGPNGCGCTTTINHPMTISLDFTSGVIGVDSGGTTLFVGPIPFGTRCMRPFTVTNSITGPCGTSPLWSGPVGFGGTCTATPL